MQFKWLTKQSVESDSGFVVTFTGKSSLEYREGGRRLVVKIEDGFSDGTPPKPAVMVFVKSITHWEGFPFRKAISEPEKSEVLDNIKQAFEFQNLVFIPVR